MRPAELSARVTMEIYLPVAEMSVHWLVIVGLGGVVGFVSGMFGVGGGFLLTPLLVFYGIPSTVAVATTLSHVTASSTSGALAQWRRRAIDFTMAGVMLAGGIAGTVVGVWLFALMRRQGQMDLIVGATYVLLLGTIGTIMLRESLASLRATHAGQPMRAHAINRAWMAKLPLKMRFRQSRLYISIIPPMGLGFVIGALGAIMGIGGGFIMVPAMIYLLRMPTNVVMGTSLTQITGVTAITTVLQATNNYAVDIVLALFLIAGGVVGAQIGVRISGRLRGEQLRLLLAVVVLAVCGGLLWGLIARPADVYSLSRGEQ
ncbi:MAG TPA: sulfite exporter TauE/SafE family protein [Rhizomicrobium sp.]|nr:sulfite exporter TauE/SafE family protein [Rhizomicrobium sp.]